MSREIRTAIELTAAPESVWQVLTDFAEYPNWNPFIRKVEGELRVGQVLEFTVATGPDSAIVSRAQILALDEQRRLVWGGSAPLGLFRGEHTFLIHGGGSGVRFENNERFTGLLAPVLVRSRRLQMQRRAFEAQNAALKRRLETLFPAVVRHSEDRS